MKCEKCGNEVPKGNQFCGKCGEKIKKKEVNSKVLYIIIAICLLVVLALGTTLVVKFAFPSHEEQKNGENLVQNDTDSLNGVASGFGESSEELDNTSQPGVLPNDVTNQEKSKNPVATIKIKNYGSIKVELYPEVAPNTVKNFINLAQNHFYDGLTIHRVVSDFIIQGGDPNGDGTGSASRNDLYKNGDKTEYCIPGEFSANGYTNTLSHKRGVVSMARADYSSYGLATQGYNSGCCQFFIVTEDATSLDGDYASFGEVLEGMEIADKISKLPLVPGKEASGTPVNPPVIESITVDTFGTNYGYPEILDAFDFTAWLLGQYN